MTAISLASKLNENIIINPLLGIWQRGVAFVGLVDGDYGADRFSYGKNGTMVHDLNRSTDVPSDASVLAKYSAFLNCTTAQPVIGIADVASYNHRIEGYNLRKVKGRNIFFSFWVKATKTGIHCMSFRNDASDRSYVTEYTINTANTWEKKTVRLKHDPTGTWDYENGMGLIVSWALAVGTNGQTGTPDEWVAGSFQATANQVNACDAINNEFRITQVQLHEGLDEIPFSKLMRDQGTEIGLCQRYFWKTYDLETLIGTSTLDGSLVNWNNGNHGEAQVAFPSAMRTQPVINSYNPITGTPNQWGRTTDGSASTFNVEAIGESCLGVTHDGSIVGFVYAVHVTADAEL